MRTRSPRSTKSTSVPQRMKVISPVWSFSLPFRTRVFRPPRVSISRAGYSSLTVASMVATREGRRSEMKVAGGLLSGMGHFTFSVKR